MLRLLATSIPFLLTASAAASGPGATRPAAPRPQGNSSSTSANRGGSKNGHCALPAVTLEHLTTHESLVLKPESNGQLSSKKLRALKHLLRCHHTGREHPIAPRLAQVLYQTAHHFGDRSITVVAGYRAPKVAKAKGNVHSPHKRGVACDFVIHGVRNSELRDYLRNAYADAGVGFYPNAGFVHVDVGRGHRAFWIDYSGPGERASYSRDPDGDLASGRATEPERARAAEDSFEEQEEEDADEPPPSPALAASERGQDRRASSSSSTTGRGVGAGEERSSAKHSAGDDPGIRGGNSRGEEDDGEPVPAANDGR